MATAAAGRLESAGRRALERGDGRAALNLLERASSLGTPGRVDISLELSVVWAMFQVGRFSDAAARASAASSRAAEAGDGIGQLRAELARLYLLAHLEPEGRLAQLGELIERARPVFEQAGDHAALGSLSMATWALEHLRCRFGAAAEAAIQAADYAAAAGEQYLATWCQTNAAAGIAFGPMPVTDALEWIDQEAALREKPPTWREFWQARLLPLIGRFDEARAAHRSDVEQMTELGDRVGVALDNGWEIEMQAGQFDRAVEAGRQSCRLLEEMGERAYWSTKACEVAQALYRLGRYEEAESWAGQAADAGASDDAITQLMSREVLAKVAARQGRFERARALAAEALAIANGMDAPLSQGDAWLDVAEVLWLAGDHSEAIRHAERAASFYRRKGATVPRDRALRFAETMESDRGDAPTT
jgi:tetratricopeptide (TPR) repeat protein